MPCILSYRSIKNRIYEFFLSGSGRSNTSPRWPRNTPTHFLNGARKALSAKERVAPRGSSPRPGSAPASLSAPEVPGFQALDTVAPALPLVAAPQPQEAQWSSASVRRRGPAPARPARHSATTPRARSRARALGQRPLGRARAPALPLTRALRSPRGPGTPARAPWKLPSNAELPC